MLVWWFQKKTKMIPWHSHSLPAHGVHNTGGEVLPDIFSADPLVGFRWWHVAMEDGYTLKSLHAAYYWGRENVAECWPSMANRVDHDGVSPHPDCACGFYTELPDQPHPQNRGMVRGRVAAFGPVNMSGRIIECDLGYKAQHVTLGDLIQVHVMCQRGCDNEPTRILKTRVLQATCDWHAAESDEYIDADMFLPELVRQLEAKYETRFMLSKEPPWISGSEDGL